MSDRRDPRAWKIDDDPFDKLESRRAPPSHSSARDDSSRRKPHIRVVMSSSGGQGGQPFFRVFGNEPQPMKRSVHKGSIWHFSEIEVEHLIQAIIAFSVALAFMSVGGILPALNSPIAFVMGGIFWLIPVAPAFIVHELAHKASARHYGCWAEFRASPGGLRFGVFLAALTGILFMAPGAVMVVGHTTKQTEADFKTVVVYFEGQFYMKSAAVQVILSNIAKPWSYLGFCIKGIPSLYFSKFVLVK